MSIVAFQILFLLSSLIFFVKYCSSLGRIKGSSPNKMTSFEKCMFFTASMDLLVPEKCFKRDLKKKSFFVFICNFF